MDKNHRGLAPVAGGSSLLTIFAILCLTVFALLALSTVQAGLRLSDASENAAAAYYKADCDAETILAQLRTGTVPDNVSADGNNIYHYSCPISDTQELKVKVYVNGTSYKIFQWQSVNTSDWQPDDTLNLWDGSSSYE